MSNPTNAVWQFESDLDGQSQSGVVSFVGVDPIRYDGGLWLEEGATNIIVNPSARVDTSGWQVFGETSATRISDDGVVIGTCFEVERTNSGGFHQMRADTVITGFSGSDAIAVHFETKSADGLKVLLALDWLTSGDDFISSTEIALVGTADWVLTEVELTAPGTAAKMRPIARALTTDNNPATPVGDSFRITDIQIVKLGYQTSFVEEGLGAGYSDSPAPNSRAASSASVPTAGIISSLSGSLAFRFTRKLDTGSLEPILEVGENTAGYDHLQMFIDGDTLWIAWDSNGALPQTIDTGHTMVVDQEYFIYTYWDGLVFGVSIDNGTPVVAQREVVTGDWGTFPLTLAAE